MKTQTKIILFLTSIFLSYILVFSGFIYFSISEYAYTDFYKRLEIRAIATAKIELENQQDVNAIKEIRQEFLEKLPNEKFHIINLTGLNQIQEAENLGTPKDFIQKIIKDKRAFYTKNNTYYSGITYETHDEKYLVVVSAENYYTTHHILYLRNILLFAIIASILLILSIAYLFSRKVVMPVKRIITDMKKIGTENLHLRLAVPQDNEELRGLTTTFNTMLNRLETSFETQKNFISNASHELNTPLTSIMGEADVALSKPRSQEDYIATLQVIVEQAEKLDKKTKALLFLAQTGYDGKVQKIEIIRVDQLVIDVKETVEKIYPDSKISLDFKLLPESPYKLKIKGNKQLLHLAFSNVIMNACKYSDNAEVKVALGVSSQHIFLVIQDKGIGIPQKELQYIYDPFFRASNTYKYDGYGIGLPLTRNIVRIHDGQLLVSSTENKGTTVEIKLPLLYI